MKKTRFTDNQIVNILEQAEKGVPIADLCREHNVGQSTAIHSKMLMWSATLLL